MPRNDFSDQFRKVIIFYKRIGLNFNLMRQSACLVVNPMMVHKFADLLNSTPVDVVFFLYMEVYASS